MPNGQSLVLDAIKKEISESFGPTDALFFGPKEYRKDDLLSAIDSGDQQVLSLATVASTRIESNPYEREMLSLYVSGQRPSPQPVQTLVPNGTPVRTDLVKQALMKELSTLSPEETFFLGSKEYSRDQLMGALQQNDPEIMQSLVIPASNYFARSEYQQLLLNYLTGQTLSLAPEGNVPQREVLLINPMFDRATSLSNQWSKSVLTTLMMSGNSVTEIGSRRVTRSEVENAIKTKNPSMIIFYDHGEDDRLLGSESESVFDTSNVQLLSNRDVYTVACLSSRVLGPTAIRTGALSYWGMRERLVFTTTVQWIYSQHLNDGIVYKITHPGSSWADALNHAYTLGDNLVRFLMSNGKPLESSCVLSNNNNMAVFSRGGLVKKPTNGQTTTCGGCGGCGSITQLPMQYCGQCMSIFQGAGQQ